MINKNEFALRLVMARRTRNLTHVHLAKLLHMSSQTVSNCENGSKIPSDETLDRLS